MAAPSLECIRRTKDGTSKSALGSVSEAVRKMGSKYKWRMFLQGQRLDSAFVLLRNFARQHETHKRASFVGRLQGDSCVLSMP